MRYPGGGSLLSCTTHTYICIYTHSKDLSTPQPCSQLRSDGSSTANGRSAFSQLALPCPPVLFFRRLVLFFSFFFWFVCTTTPTIFAPSWLVHLRSQRGGLGLRKRNGEEWELPCDKLPMLLFAFAFAFAGMDGCLCITSRPSSCAHCATFAATFAARSLCSILFYRTLLYTRTFEPFSSSSPLLFLA